MVRGKYAIVTGASRGIGYAIAEMLVKEGCTVTLTGRHEETVCRAAERLGSRAIPLVWDSSDLSLAEARVNEAAERMGGLDILVNNAGIFAQRGEWGKNGLLATTAQEWESVIRTNLSGQFFAMQAAVRYMLKNGVKGNILNVTSVAGEEPVYGAYGASKRAATALTRGWGRMFAADGITINGIAPGPVATEMNGWHEGDPMEHDRIPYGRFSTASEIAELAKYLLSPSAAMVCGETVILDGGYATR